MYFWAQAWPLNYLLKKPVVTSVTQISCTEWDVLTNHQAGKWATTARVSLSAFLRVTPLDVCEDNTRYFKETWGHLHVCGDQSLIYFAISWFIYSHVCSNKLSPSIVLFVCFFTVAEIIRNPSSSLIRKTFHLFIQLSPRFNSPESAPLFVLPHHQHRCPDSIGGMSWSMHSSTISANVPSSRWSPTTKLSGTQQCHSWASHPHLDVRGKWPQCEYGRLFESWQNGFGKSDDHMIEQIQPPHESTSWRRGFLAPQLSEVPCEDALW